MGQWEIIDVRRLYGRTCSGGREIRFLILIAATGVAWHLAGHRDLRWYFAAQFVNALVGEGTLLFTGESSHVYLATYMVIELLVFVAMVPLVYSALCFHPSRSIASGAGAIIAAWLAYLSVHGRLTGIYDWVTAIDGGLLVAFAIPTGMGAAYLKGQARTIALSLMCLWLALAAFRLGFTLHWASALWNEMNEWVPTALVAIGCLWIARIDQESIHA